MKRFVFLILLICLTINYQYNVCASSEPVVKCKTCDQWKDLRIALENLLHVKVKKLDTSFDEYMAINGSVYQTEDEKFVFVKTNGKPESDQTFQNEFEGLKAIRDTNTLMAPRPIATGRTKSGQNFIVMEFINMTFVRSKAASELGTQLADMHLCNLNNKCGTNPAVKKFGYHISSDIDMIPQNNTWNDDWIKFFIENRMDYQVSLLYASREYTLEKENVVEIYWPKLKPYIHKFFEGIDVKPSLLHGNLWSDNISEWKSKPVVYDPAVFYGHHEFDIAGAIHFNKSCTKYFHNTYFKKIPKAVGIKNRILLYQLYHELNHWNFFGGAYGATNTFLELLEICKKFD